MLSQHALRTAVTRNPECLKVTFSGIWRHVDNWVQHVWSVPETEVVLSQPWKLGCCVRSHAFTPMATNFLRCPPASWAAWLEPRLPLAPVRNSFVLATKTVQWDGPAQLPSLPLPTQVLFPERRGTELKATRMSEGHGGSTGSHRVNKHLLTNDFPKNLPKGPRMNNSEFLWTHRGDCWAESPQWAGHTYHAGVHRAGLVAGAYHPRGDGLHVKVGPALLRRDDAHFSLLQLERHWRCAEET